MLIARLGGKTVYKNTSHMLNEVTSRQ